MNVWVYDPKAETYRRVSSLESETPEYLVPFVGGKTTGALFLTRTRKTPLRSSASEPQQVRYGLSKAGLGIYTIGTPLLVIEGESYLYYLDRISRWSSRKARLIAWLRCRWAMLRSDVHRQTPAPASSAISSEGGTLYSSEIATRMESVSAALSPLSKPSNPSADPSSRSCPPKDSKTSGNGTRPGMYFGHQSRAEALQKIQKTSSPDQHPTT